MKRNVVVMLVILGVILIGGAAFVMMRKPSTPTGTPGEPTSSSAKLPPPTLIEVPFEYTVKSITSSEVVLNGQEGDITFPTNFAIKYVSGDRGSNQTTTLSALRVGQKVNLDMIPGQSATIYILSSR